jgi:iron complex outermembrane recepter protein
MTYTRILVAALLSGAAGVALSTEAHAQTTSASPASDSAPGAENGTIQDIVVTARKREERLQDVPVAVTAVTSETLQAAHITNITSLGAIAPNVNISNFANFSFNVAAVIRGIGTIDFEPSSDPAVAIFVDGVYQSSTNGSAIDFFDLDAVQVLRGPQGTLFGRNATAGAILVNTKRPTGDFGLRAQATAGNYGQLEFRAAAEAPIVDGVLAAKISVLRATDDGYYTNFDGRRLGKKDVFAIRPSLLFTPSSALTVYLTGQYIKDRTQSIPGINAGTPYQAGAIGADRGDYNTTSNSSKFDYDSDDKSVTLNADLKAASGTFTLIGNYRDYGYFNFYDVDAQRLTILDVPRTERHKQYSGELRYASAFDGPFNFVTGVLALHQQYRLNYTIVADGNFFAGGPFGSGPGTTQLAVRSQQDADSLSGYLQGTFKFSDRLSIDLGGNYSHEKKDFVFFNGFAPPGTPPTPASRSWNNFGPKAGINFKATDSVLVYATFSRGFRSGGFNGRASFLANIGPYDVEKVDAYEVGIKSDLFDRRVRLNISAFNNNFTGLQRPLNNPAFPVESVTTNAANARIRGVEAELLYKPIPALTLGVNGSYLDAKYSRYFSNVGGTGADLSGLRLANAPKFQSHVFADLTGDVASGWVGNFHAEYDHMSSTFTDTANSPGGLRRPTNIVNLSASVGPQDERVKFGLFVRNLTREVYVVSSQVSFPFVNEFTLNAPRTFGGEVSFKF